MKVYEVIYNENYTARVGRQELDHKTLVMAFDENSKDFVWVQFPNEPPLTRMLLQCQVEIDREVHASQYKEKKRKPLYL